jgi:hypothetical protein
MNQRWGNAGAALVAQRLQELDAVERLGDLELLPYLRLVPVRSGVVTVRDRNGVQIRLRPEVHKRSGSAPMRWRDSTKVVILDVVLVK